MNRIRTLMAALGAFALSADTSAPDAPGVDRAPAKSLRWAAQRRAASAICAEVTARNRKREYARDPLHCGDFAARQVFLKAA